MVCLMNPPSAQRSVPNPQPAVVSAGTVYPPKARSGPNRAVKVSSCHGMLPTLVQCGTVTFSTAPDADTVRVGSYVRPSQGTRAVTWTSSIARRPTCGASAAAGTQMISLVWRAAALRLTSGPVADMTVNRPSRRWRISPVSALYRSKPWTGRPNRRVVTTQMKPSSGASAWTARNRRQEPRRIMPCWPSTTVRRSGVPAAIACRSQRRAGAGRWSTVPGSKSCSGSVGRVSWAQSARSDDGSRCGVVEPAYVVVVVLLSGAHRGSTISSPLLQSRVLQSRVLLWSQQPWPNSLRRRSCRLRFQVSPTHVVAPRAERPRARRCPSLVKPFFAAGCGRLGQPAGGMHRRRHRKRMYAMSALRSLRPRGGDRLAGRDVSSINEALRSAGAVEPAGAQPHRSDLRRAAVLPSGGRGASWAHVGPPLPDPGDRLPFRRRLRDLAAVRSRP